MKLNYQGLIQEGFDNESDLQIFVENGGFNILYHGLTSEVPRSILGQYLKWEDSGIEFDDKNVFKCGDGETKHVRIESMSYTKFQFVTDKFVAIYYIGEEEKK